MRDLTDRALDTATARGATYAEARIVRREERGIVVKSGTVGALATSESEGIGVRALVDGAWGFASTRSLDPADAERAAADAVRIARASATAVLRPVELDERSPARGTYATEVRQDPFAVPLERTVATLLEADERMRAVGDIAFSEAVYAAQREAKTFASSDGSFVDFYSVSIPSAGTYLFTQTGNFDTYLALLSSGAIVIGVNDDFGAANVSRAARRR